MAYATVVDVSNLAPLRRFTPSARDITDTMVVSYLQRTAGEIDGVLRQAGYQLPIDATATTALEHLRNVNAAGAHALVEANAPSTKEGAATAARKEFERLLAQLDPTQKGPTVDLDAPRDAREAFARSGTFGSGAFQPDQEL